MSVYLPARLCMCLCGLHGHIVFYDESRSDELYTKEEVSDCITNALLEGKLIMSEAILLRQAVQDTNIPPDEPTRKMLMELFKSMTRASQSDQAHQNSWLN